MTLSNTESIEEQYIEEFVTIFSRTGKPPHSEKIFLKIHQYNNKHILKEGRLGMMVAGRKVLLTMATKKNFDDDVEYEIIAEDHILDFPSEGFIAKVDLVV